MGYLIIFIVVIIVAGLAIKCFKKIFKKNKKSSYSLLEILWPFNKEPFKMYKHLSSENKTAFWSVIGSLIVCVITCWLGFTVQYVVADSSKDETAKLNHSQLVDKFRPMYMELFDDSSKVVIHAIYDAGLSSFSKDSKEKSNKNIANYAKHLMGDTSVVYDKEAPEIKLFLFAENDTNWAYINYATKKCFNVSSEIAPYLDKEDADTILKNNMFLLLSSQLFDALLVKETDDSLSVNNVPDLDSVSFIKKYKKEYVEYLSAGLVGANKNIDTIYQSAYELYNIMKNIQNVTNKTLAQDIDVGNKILALTLVNSFMLYPFEKNKQIINDAFLPIKKKNPWIKPLWALVICVFLGYELFRILLMTVFNRNSLEPNPQMSQSEARNLKKRLKSYEEEEIVLEVHQDRVSELREQLEKTKQDRELYISTNSSLRRTNDELNKRVRELENKIIRLENQTNQFEE